MHDQQQQMSETSMSRLLVPMIAATVLLAGCNGHRDDGGGPTISRTYPVTNFQQIEVAGPYDVEVRTGGNASVSAQGPEHMLERTEVAIEGNKLVIRARHHGGWFQMGWSHHGDAHFVVTVPQLSAAELTGSGEVKVDKVQGQSFDGAVTGSGDLSIANLAVQSLKLSITGSGDVKAGAGKAQAAEYAITGSGDLDAGAIDSPQIKASIAGSGDLKAHGSGTANIDIMGSGDVYISGGAKCSATKAGSGEAHCS